MKNIARGVAIFTLMLVPLLVFGQLGETFNILTTETYGVGKHWETTQISYMINDSTLPPDVGEYGIDFEGIEDCIVSAFDELEDHSDFAFTYSGTTTLRGDEEDGYNVLLFVTGESGELDHWGGSSFRAAAYVYCPNIQTGIITDVDIVFNAVQYCVGGKGCYRNAWTDEWMIFEEIVFDVQSIATHEIGHLVGIGHSDPYWGESGYPNTYPTMMSGGLSESEIDDGDPKSSVESPYLQLRSLSESDIDALDYVSFYWLGIPQNLRFTGTINQPISIAWDAAENATSYQVWRNNFYSGWTLEGTTSSTNFTDNDYMWVPQWGNDSLQYKVRAKNAVDVYSDYSDILGTRGEPNFDRMPADDPKAIQAVTDFLIEPNYPNPFNPETEILFGLPEPSKVKITILDMLGREIMTLLHQDYGAGFHKAIWRGADVTGARVGSGVYFCRIEALGQSGKEFTSVIKMNMTK